MYFVTIYRNYLLIFNKVDLIDSLRDIVLTEKAADRRKNGQTYRRTNQKADSYIQPSNIVGDGDRWGVLYNTNTERNSTITAVLYV